MRRAARISASLIVGIGLSAAPLVAQGATGPEMDRKGARASAVTAWDSPGREVEWLSWSQDDAVALMVYQPIKILGLRRFPTEARPELKRLIGRAEERIRVATRAHSIGEAEAAATVRTMREALDEYRSAVAELLAPR